MVNLIVSSENPLVDDIIEIIVTGLQKGQHLTVKTATFEGNSKFSSFACFDCKENGRVNLSNEPALSGTYKDVKPMGLFWSMQQSPGQEPGKRYTKRIVTTPQEVTLSVFDGHLTWDQVHSEASMPMITKVINRWFKAENVKRIEIKTEKLKGTLFIPPGPGPFPGVIDMFGTIGGIVEFRAAMLSNKGFITLALQYFDSFGSSDVDFKYLQNAVRWLSSHPATLSSGIGIVGVSKGGELALLLSTACPQVTAAVNINGPPFISLDPIPPFEKYVYMDKMKSYALDESGNMAVRSRDSICKNLTPELLTPAWEHDTKVLCIIGEDDQSIHPRCAQMLYDAYPPHKKGNIEVVVYPRAGHLIEPPYLPHCYFNTKTFNDDFRRNISIKFYWGGEMESHSFAQEDSWKRIVTFLKSNLLNIPRSELHSNL